MDYRRNLLFFTLIGILASGCGGGNSTIATNYTSNSSSGVSGSTPGTANTTSNGSATGSITLNWSAPTSYLDNSPASLSDISGYRLYYGASATNTPNYVNISNGAATQYTITLPSGTYYFRISAIDSSGYEGALSVAQSKTL